MKKVLLAGVLISALISSGCMVGMLSKMESFSGNDLFSIEASRSDILDVIAVVGKEMGMSVTSLDKKQGMIELTSTAQGGAGMFVGSMNDANLSVLVKDAGKTLDVSTRIMANLGRGGQDGYTKLIENFRIRLEKKLGQSVVRK